MATFEGYERRIGKIEGVLKQYGFTDLDSMAQFVKDKGVDVDGIVRGVQPIAFENAVWAYTLGAAIALKKACKTAAEAATAIGEGLQAFCIPGSVAEQRLVGLGHGNLAAMLLEERRDASASSRDTSPSRRRKARSALPRQRTRCAKKTCKLS